MIQSKSSRLAELLQKAREDIASRALAKSPQDFPEIPIITVKKSEIVEEKSGPIWSPEQLSAITLAKTGRSFCLIGKAGTGKTTIAKECVKVLQQEGVIGPLNSGTKYLVSGLPGIAVISFTNRAVKNIAKGMPADIAKHTITIHKLLEYQPVWHEIPDPENEGLTKKVMRFEPGRNKKNPLPASLRCVIVEESSMVDTELWQKLMDAIPHTCQFILLGDLQQLPPVYGSPILGYKLLEYPVVELTRIYRQGEGSPIIDLAWRVSTGDPIPASQFEMINLASHGKLVIKPWKKNLDAEGGLHIMNLFFKQAIDLGHYLPEEDMIMIPFNKSFGTIEFNLNLADYLGKKRNAIVHQIIAGFTTHYYAVGDKVLCDRQEAIIEDIMINDMYRGRSPIPASSHMNRWGIYDKKTGDTDEKEKHLTMEELELLMQDAIARDGQDEEVKQQGSHVLVCRILDSDEIREIRTTGEYSATVFAYALTVHKCQGSEWRKCFLILHRSHAQMLSRELLYTAVTRAREELVMIVEPDVFVKASKNQRIRGNTIAEKAEFFKGKLSEKED